MKMSEERVRAMYTIVALRRRGYTYTKIAEVMGIHRSTVRQTVARYNHMVRRGRLVGKEVG